MLITIYVSMYTGLIVIVRTYVFEWFAEFCQLIEALFYYVRCPLVDLVVLVGISSDSSLYRLKRTLIIERNYTTTSNYTTFYLMALSRWNLQYFN